MKKPKLLIRIAAGCLIFFATGHTIGHVTRHDVSDPKAKAVLHVMAENRFDMFGQLRSYDENYTGMSLNLIFTLLMLSAILWILSSQAVDQPIRTRHILIPIGLCILAFSATSYCYFFMLPAITCLVAGALIFTSVFALRGIIVVK